MKQTVIMLATLGVLILGAAPSEDARANIDSQVATVHVSIPTASVGWAVDKWAPGPAADLLAVAIAGRSTWLGWRIGSQIGGLFAGIAGAAVGGALGGL